MVRLSLIRCECPASRRRLSGRVRGRGARVPVCETFIVLTTVPGPGGSRLAPLSAVGAVRSGGKGTASYIDSVHWVNYIDIVDIGRSHTKY